MCPFCIGAAAWAAAGVVSAGGLGALAAVVSADRRGTRREANGSGKNGDHGAEALGRKGLDDSNGVFR